MSRTDEQHSAMLKVLADENRLRLVRLIWREELNVQELCEILDLPQPKVSRHLAVLRSAGLVRDRREGSRAYYAAGQLDPSLALIAEYVQRTAAQEHPDLERMAACLRKRTRLSRDFASQRADEWDEIGMQLHSSTAALFALGSLAPRGLTLADLGTGTGLMLPILSAFADTVYAVDHSAEMLAHARRRCEEYGIGNVRFLCADLENVGEHLAGACHCLLLHFVLHQVASPASVIQGVSRCLAPGGRLVIVDRVRHDDEQARARFGSLWLGFEEAKIRQWLLGAGLGDVRYHTLKSTTTDHRDFVVFVAAAGLGSASVP